MSLEIDLVIGKGHTLVIDRDMRDHIPICLIGIKAETLIEIGVNEGIREIGRITIDHKVDICLVGSMDEIILHIMIGMEEIIFHIMKGVVEINHHIIIIEIIHQILLEEIQIILEMTVGIIGILLLLTATIGTMISQDIIIIILTGGTQTIWTMVPMGSQRCYNGSCKKDLLWGMTLARVSIS